MGSARRLDNIVGGRPRITGSEWRQLGLCRVVQRPQAGGGPVLVQLVLEVAPQCRGRIPTAAQRASVTRQAVPAGEYDIIVDVPNLCVDSLTLKVENLVAHLALDARVANLTRITAGADVRIGEVDLRLRQVRAEALLLVDLDHVRFIVDDLLTMLDNNPEIIESLVATVEGLAGTAGGVAKTALQPGGVVSQAVSTVGATLGHVTQPGGVLSQTINTLGQTIQHTFDASGRLLERTLDTAGSVVNERTLGNLAQMDVLNEVVRDGRTVRTVRTAAGDLTEYTSDSAGRILSARTVRQR
jgi:YD repeat-containing protein